MEVNLSLKTLHAKGILVKIIKQFGIPVMILILFALFQFLKNYMMGGTLIILLTIISVFMVTSGDIRLYRTHQIQYGNGKVLIRRFSKRIVDNVPVGEWEVREDEFSMDEIVAYGLSWQILGYYVEYHCSSQKSIATECFFQLKDGRRIGYEMTYYTKRQEEEFMKYLYEGTGIAFRKD